LKYRFIKQYLILSFILFSTFFSKKGVVGQKKDTISKMDKISYNNCYFPIENKNIRIIHFIITRFLNEFSTYNGFPKRLYTDEYLMNGIRVMKKYLLPSLEKQFCKNFIWILMLGEKANLTLVKSLLDLNYSFETEIVYQKNIKNYIKNKSKDFDFLITTRIDYDDIIYYDSVNDVRKLINIKHPILLHGYNRGYFYMESMDKYYNFYNNFNNKGIMSIFISLILNLNKVNDTYTVYDLGNHVIIKEELLRNYKKFGIKELDYDPFVIDNGSPKFIYVRQNHSFAHNTSGQFPKNLKSIDLNISKFYGF
jgi:hypothetical protein